MPLYWSLFSFNVPYFSELASTLQLSRGLQLSTRCFREKVLDAEEKEGVDKVSESTSCDGLLASLQYTAEMHLRMSSESLHAILGTYSAIEALKKFARQECPEVDLGSPCEYFNDMKAASDYLTLGGFIRKS